MTQQVILKKSSVESKVPTTGDLDFGELAINYTDGRLYYKDSTIAIKYFISSDQIASTYQPTLVSGPTSRPSMGYLLLALEISLLAGHQSAMQ
jgi:hypothetical protein